jgi:hypothetical protein
VSDLGVDQEGSTASSKKLRRIRAISEMYKATGWTLRQLRGMAADERRVTLKALL